MGLRQAFGPGNGLAVSASAVSPWDLDRADSLAPLLTRLNQIRREHRVRMVGHVLMEGTIDTFPTIGSTLFEPWRRDSVSGFEKT